MKRDTSAAQSHSCVCSCGFLAGFFFLATVPHITQERLPSDNLHNNIRFIVSRFLFFVSSAATSFVLQGCLSCAYSCCFLIDSLMQNITNNCSFYDPSAPWTCKIATNDYYHHFWSEDEEKYVRKRTNVYSICSDI